MLRKRTWYRIYSGLFLLALVWAAAFGAYSGRYSQSVSGAPIVQPGNVSEQDSDVMLGMSTDDFLMILFTFALVVVGGLQFLQLQRTNISAATVERAYVKMSHVPPGLVIDEVSGLFFVGVKVKNFGRTPARITDVLLKSSVLPKGEPLPTTPDYSRTRGEDAAKAFLVAEDEFDHHETLEMDAENVPSVQDGTKTLWLYGYVDYVDQFGQRHRAGYARVYRPPKQEEERRNNLHYVRQAGYNYDRPRRRREGNDWEEELSP